MDVSEFSYDAFIIFCRLGSFGEEITWLHFLALACSSINTVCIFCQYFNPSIAAVVLKIYYYVKMA